MQSRTATLIETRELAPGIRHFVFAVEGEAEFSFIPGQFVSFTETLDGKPITRAYSIASTPSGNRFELCLNLVEEGRFSPHLFGMQPGDSVPMKGPLGSFLLKDFDREILFVATGTGIAPIRGLIHQALRVGVTSQMTLLYGARHEEGLLYRDEFERLESKLGSRRFCFLPTLTQPSPEWEGRTGRVQHHLDAALGGQTDLDVYICGMKEMVNSVRASLKAYGVDRKNIIYEKYD